MRVSRWFLFTLVSLTCFVFSQAIDVGARDVHKGPKGKDLPGMEGVMVLDGSNVHNVGQLRMHVGNWGLFGSMPTASAPFSFAPSAEWPVGSGVEYLYSAGICIGALKNGIPAVSTSQFETEFRPTNDPIDIIYRSHDGAPGGNRFPNPNADDDHDGKIDEDWLNGHDDDLDGLVDEDFAAISDQMFSCWYTDDQPVAIPFPEHNPLGLKVRQESYQWESNGFDDFVAVDFEITNIGDELLEDVYISVFADFDCGPRTRPNYWADDAVGFHAGSEPPYGPEATPLAVSYGYDADGDGGLTPGWLGVLLLDHTTDPTGETAPSEVGAVTYANFSGSQSFEEGGDPTNDFERYELLSSQTIERNMSGGDCRSLVAVGPFPWLDPGKTVMFRIAFVAGPGFQGMMENAASAMRLYKNNWHTGEEAIQAKLDIQPGMCPNRLVVTPPDRGPDMNAGKNDESMAGGVLHAALLGRAGFNVTHVDVRSLRLEGVPPVKRPAYRDVGTEPMRERACVCPGKDPDGIMDLVLKFRQRDVVAALLPVSDGEERILTLTGKMMDGQPFRAVDCVRIDMRGRPDDAESKEDRVVLRSVTPNPFNPVTRVSYYVPDEAYVTIAVYDVTGRLVDRLVSQVEQAGEHTIEWNASRAPSGIYFCRLEAAGVVDTRKLVVMK